MHKPYRAVLPIALGAISAPFVVWDIHNQRVIAGMGMAWDTGPPVWPYQTPDILLHLINAPAYILATPIANWLKLWLHVGASYLATGPLILVWWWFVGSLLDRGVVKQSRNGRWFLFSFLIVLGLALLWAAAMVSADALQWWAHHGRNVGLATSLMLVRLLTPAIWLAVIATLAGVAASKVARQKNASF